jgi:hypothetical protein
MTRRTGNKPGNPAWYKGCPSPNPKGRPPSTHSLAEHIRRKVDPDTLSSIAVEIALDVDVDPKDRIAALKFLADHGWSRPISTVEVTTGLPLNLSNLTDEQLAALATLEADAARTDGDPQ